jgi:MFS family permease
MTQTAQTIRLLKAYRFTAGLMFILPVMVPYWNSRGLNQTEIGLLQTAFTATVLILQLPTGRLADVYGRRRLILIGSVLAVIGFAGYSLANGFWGMLLAELVLGLGYSCKSGADLALLRQRLEEADRVVEEKHIIGQLSSFNAAGELVSAIIGGWAASWALGLPLWMTVFGISLAIPFAAALPTDKPQESSKQTRAPLRLVLGGLINSPRMLAITCFSASAGVATHLFVWLFQPYLQTGGLGIGWFGLMWALFNATYMLFSWRVSAIERKLGERVSMALILAAPAVAYLGLGLGMSLWLLPLTALFTLSRALNGPIITHLVHEHTDAAHYATTLSGLATMQGIIYALMGPLSGWLVDTYGLQTNLLFLGSLLSITGVISYRLLSRHHLSPTT